MDQLLAQYNLGMNQVTNTLNDLLANPYVTAMVSLFIILYSSLAAPNLPKGVAKLFDNTIIKVLILALILFINNFNPTIAILVAVGFFLTLQTLSRHNMLDMASNFMNVKKLMGLGNKREEEHEEEHHHEEERHHEEAYPHGGPDAYHDYGLNMETQVSGLANRNQHYQGPQGMKHPVGFGGFADGADY